MEFKQITAELYIPDGSAVDIALPRTTHLAVSAHQDDIEIMAVDPILKGYQQKDTWFSAVVLTDGRGSPRNGVYSNFSDEEMRLVRLNEQKKAAVVGNYSALALLDYPSRAIKDPADERPVQDLVSLLRAMRPEVVYTHNLADKHDTHVGTALRVIEAIRRLSVDERPQTLYGCEVWRSLDWMLDSRKVVFDVSQHENLQAALLGVFDSQIAGGKRYDLASMGRRKANATYFESHGLDTTTGISFGMDLSPLISGEPISIPDFIQEQISSFAKDVSDRLAKLA
jgi:LmbE family N-acetylglucosaminyl deacetylase